MKKRHFGLAVCVLPALYLLLSPVYALLNYDLFAAEAPHFVRYVVIPGLLAACFLVLGLFARPNLSILAGVCGSSILLGLFLFEAMHTVTAVSVRLGMFGQLSEAQAETLRRNDNMVPGFTLRYLNRVSGTDELPEALLSGFPAAEVVLCTSGDGVVSYTADRYGFNNPDDLYDDPLDLMLLGDSFVEGFCLPPGDDLASQLRAGGIRTASIGIRGNGPLTELAALGRFGEILRPRRVMMVFFEGNDWENLERELAVPWLRTALSPDADFGLQSAVQNAMRQARSILTEHRNAAVTSVDLLTRTALFRNFVALQQTLTRLGLVYPKITPSNPEFRRILHRAKQLTESWGGSFTLVYVPRIDRFMGPFSSDRPFDPLRIKVLGAAAAEGIEVIDLNPAIRAQADPLLMYAPDAHFSRTGAEFAASEILRGVGAATPGSRQLPGQVVENE
ncbi:SGNH/GDSL hydrolase family protein [Sinorhizobium medicae]|uniref:SGNH/GDSL hydrolase family protein n=1 Tax=Sinorhizobium medicae TaxID=110321 RepID=UPI000FD7B0E2|nr:SGNH/GDSL hydrolase family protein [Sinorhizobium medicae]RVP52447.1 SGNH/GDSL hydrolase family protein [Sinorhizobium medicae]RVP77167.1 SGNH/GDSL hydrolase family protein [Sinorhizobium medicae]UWU06672.1 SGNH/GDSL hydrolase family protein [Sinorhizobium medicae]